MNPSSGPDNDDFFSSLLEQILFSWKRDRFQLNNVICSHINLVEQIRAPKLNHNVIQFKPDLLYGYLNG